MSDTLVSVRPATFDDCEDLATIHEEAWLSTYRGLLDGIELQKMVQRRSPNWWKGALERGVHLNVIMVTGVAAGYATYGSCRTPSDKLIGEIYELYLRPEYQGLGFGRTLFEATRQSLALHGMTELTVQVLRDNTSALGFYQALGGKQISRSSYKSGKRQLELSTFGWASAE